MTSGTALDPTALEATRRSLAQELSTYRGFRRRVRISTVLQVAGLLAPIGLLLLVDARVGFVVWIRREHRWFGREGWVAFHGATGWVMVTSDGPSAVVHDHRAIGGAAERRPRDLGDPIVLVSGPQTSAVDFGRTLAAVRASVAGRPYDEAALKDLYRQSARWRSIPAGPWFAAATGCLLGQGDDGPFTAVIPRPYKDGRRTRLARIKLTKDEKDVLGHPA